MSGYQLLVILIASLSSFLFTYELSTMSAVKKMDSFLVYFNPTNTYEGYNNINNLSLYYNIGIFCSAIVTIFMGLKLNHKLVALITCIICTIFSICQSFLIHNFTLIIISRFIIGFASGMNMTLLIVYLAEISRSKNRGKVIICYGLMGALGSVVSDFVNNYFRKRDKSFTKDLNIVDGVVPDVSKFDHSSWKMAFVVNAIIGLLISALTFFLPKSPRLLWLKDGEESATRVITRFYGNDYMIVNEELDDIKKEVDDTNNNGTGFSQLFGSLIRSRTFIVLILNIFLNLFGFNVMVNIFYLNNEDLTLGDDSHSYLIENIFSILNVVGIISMLVGMCLIDKVGRKNLLMIGSGLNLIIYVIAFVLIKSNIDWKIAVVVIIFYFNIRVTWAIVPIVYQAEVFPLRVRIKGNAMGLAIEYLFSFIISRIETVLIFNSLGTKTLLVYIPLWLIALIITALCLRESKNINLGDMDDELGGSKNK